MSAIIFSAAAFSAAICAAVLPAGGGLLAKDVGDSTLSGMPFLFLSKIGVVVGFVVVAVVVVAVVLPSNLLRASFAA